jgi:hypothetical protein
VFTCGIQMPRCCSCLGAHRWKARVLGNCTDDQETQIVAVCSCVHTITSTPRASYYINNRTFVARLRCGCSKAQVCEESQGSALLTEALVLGVDVNHVAE